MQNNTLGDFHNPAYLTDDEIGTKDGWRLLRSNETIEEGDEWWSNLDDRFHMCDGNVGSEAGSKIFTHRTRRPDPLAKPQVTPQGWTRFSDAMPTGPFWAWSKDAQVVFHSGIWDAKRAMDGGVTHWHPAPPLPEPPREESQREKDEAAFRELDHTIVWYPQAALNVEKAWHAALAYERAEVAKMLPAIPKPGDSMTERQLAQLGMELVKAIDAIRARVGGGR